MTKFANWVREHVNEEYLHMSDMRELFKGEVGTLYPFTLDGWRELGVQYGGHKLWARGGWWYIGIITPPLLIRRPPREVKVVISNKGRDVVIGLPIGEREALRSHEIVEMLDNLIRSHDFPEGCVDALAYLLGAYWYYEGRL
jgi:hypothetical protein